MRLLGLNDEKVMHIVIASIELPRVSQLPVVKSSPGAIFQ